MPRRLRHLTAQDQAWLDAKYQPAALLELVAHREAAKGKPGRPPQSEVEAICNKLGVWLLVVNKRRDTTHLKVAYKLASDLLRDLYDEPWRYGPGTVAKMYREGASIMKCYPRQHDTLIELLPTHRCRPVFNRHGEHFLPREI